MLSVMPRVRKMLDEYACVCPDEHGEICQLMGSVGNYEPAQVNRSLLFEYSEHLV